LLTPRPPSSPLFPYTTLFRSRRGTRPRDRGGRPARGRGARAGGGRSGGRDPALAGRAKLRPLPRLRGARGALPRAGRADVGDARDRKSTRLNSSHVKISYAVF